MPNAYSPSHKPNKAVLLGTHLQPITPFSCPHSFSHYREKQRKAGPHLGCEAIHFARHLRDNRQIVDSLVKQAILPRHLPWAPPVNELHRVYSAPTPLSVHPILTLLMLSRGMPPVYTPRHAATALPQYSEAAFRYDQESSEWRPLPSEHFASSHRLGSERKRDRTPDFRRQ
jgi:hypothetical protein